MKTPIMTTNDTGNGNMIEIAMLIPKDIPIHITWLIRNPLLLIPNFALISSYLHDVQLIK